MEIKISEVIRNKRREMNVSQESLAEAFGITVQAVSKWETGLSYPDITLLPQIAEYFHISLNELFFGVKEEKAILGTLPDDDEMRIIQCCGRKIMKADSSVKNDPFELIIPDNEAVINFSVWGSANIEGDVSGNVSAGAGLSCANVGGDASAGAGLCCADVGRNAEAGAGLTCGPVGGDVDSGSSVTCGTVNGNVNAGNTVKCGSVGGDVEVGSDLECENISGDVTAYNVTCEEIKGNVKCDNKVIIKQ